jgi:hypothetical protein
MNRVSGGCKFQPCLSAQPIFGPELQRINALPHWFLSQLRVILTTTTFIRLFDD